MRKPLFVRESKLHERRFLAKLAAHSNDGKQTRKALAIRLSAEGKTPSQIAAIVGVHSTTVQRWLSAFNKQGLDSLKPRKSPGRPRKADEEFETAAKQALLQSPGQLGYNATVWSAHLLRGHLRQVTHQEVCLRTIYNLIHRLDFRYKRPKLSLKHKQDPADAARAKRAKRHAQKKLRPEPVVVLSHFSTKLNSI